jgi:pimeloyl-ACP methyl ester carboxylesterase
MADNAPTFLDEIQDPEALGIDESELKRLDLPVHFTHGSESPPMFARVIERVAPLIPGASREVIEGASHEPQISMAERYVEVVTRAVRATA